MASGPVGECFLRLITESGAEDRISDRIPPLFSHFEIDLKLECTDSDGSASLRDSQASLHKIEQTYNEMDSIYKKLCMVKEQKFLTESKLPRSTANFEPDTTQRRLAFSDQKESDRATGRFPTTLDMELGQLDYLAAIHQGNDSASPRPPDTETGAVLKWLRNNPRSHNQLVHYQQALFQTGFPPIAQFARRLLEDDKQHYTVDEITKILGTLTPGTSFGRFVRTIAGILSNPSFLSKSQLAAVALVFGAGNCRNSPKEATHRRNGRPTANS